jgi:LTXXQ motif family protein
VKHFLTLGVVAAMTCAAAAAQPMGPRGMMGGMPMMNRMPMMGGPMGGMGMIDHVEGRIAFLRTELKVTEAQTGVWNGFAEALRTNARRLGEARGAMMPRQCRGQAQAPTLAQRLDMQERWFAARLDGTRALKASVASLYASFSEEQKQLADDLLAPNIGMGMGMMAMMAGSGP